MTKEISFGGWFNSLNPILKDEVGRRPGLVGVLFDRPELRSSMASAGDLSQFLASYPDLDAAATPFGESARHVPHADFIRWWSALNPSVRSQILNYEHLVGLLFSDITARAEQNVNFDLAVQQQSDQTQMRRILPRLYPAINAYEEIYMKHKPEVEDMLTRITLRDPDGKEVDWQKKFGTQAVYEDVLDYVKDSVPAQSIEQYPGMKMGKGEFKDRDGEHVKYFYYQLPLSVFIGYLRGKMPVNEVLNAQEFSAIFEHEYGCEVPMIGLAVRSSESKKLDTDFGTVALTSGWTGNTFDITTLKKNVQDKDEHSLLKYLLGSGSRGHSSVFLLPSLHFAGALNLKDEKGQFLPYEKLRERTKGVEAIASGDETSFWLELFSSGRAANFYQDLLSSLGTYNFIGHSRGGEVANLIASTNYRRIKPINCLALMPASGLSEQNLLNPWQSGAMQRLFISLDALVHAGNLPGVARLQAVETLSQLMTSYLIRDANIPGVTSSLGQLLPFPDGENSWLLKDLSQSHKQVIEHAYYKAVAKVIGNLGIAFRGQWPLGGYDWFPALNVLGEQDSLSVPASVLPFLDMSYTALEGRLAPWTTQENEKEFLSEIRQQTQLVIPGVGHYGFMIPKMRELIFEGKKDGVNVRKGWWDTLELLTPTPSDIRAVEFVKRGMEDHNSFIIPTIVRTENRDYADTLDSQLDAMKAKGAHHNVLRLTVYEFEKLRRILAYGLKTPYPLEQVWTDNEQEIVSASEFIGMVKDEMETLRTNRLRSLWDTSEIGQVSGMRLFKLNDFAKDVVRALKTPQQARDILAILYLEIFQQAGHFTLDTREVMSPIMLLKFDQKKETHHNGLLTALQQEDDSGVKYSQTLDEWTKDYWFYLSDSASYVWQTLTGTTRQFSSAPEFLSAVRDIAINRARQLTGINTQDEKEVAISFITSLYDQDRQNGKLTSADLLLPQALEKRFPEMAESLNSQTLSGLLGNLVARNLCRDSVTLSSDQPVRYPDDTWWQELLNDFLAQKELGPIGKDDLSSLVSHLKLSYAQAARTLSEKIK